MAYPEGHSSDNGGIVVDGPILSSNDIFDINDASDHFMIPSSSAFDDSAKLFADDYDNDEEMLFDNL